MDILCGVMWYAFAGISLNEHVKRVKPVSPSIKMSSSFVRTGWTMVFKVVAGNLVSRNIQEFWSSNSALNLQDIEALNVGSSVKTSYKSRYVKRWTSIKPKKVEAAKQRFSLL